MERTPLSRRAPRLRVSQNVAGERERENTSRCSLPMYKTKPCARCTVRLHESIYMQPCNMCAVPRGINHPHALRNALSSTPPPASRNASIQGTCSSGARAVLQTKRCPLAGRLAGRLAAAAISSSRAGCPRGWGSTTPSGRAPRSPCWPRTCPTTRRRAPHVPSPNSPPPCRRRRPCRQAPSRAERPRRRAHPPGKG